MKTYQSHLSDPLHAAFKAALKGGYGKLTLSEGFELGALLVMLELGAPVDAQALGVGDRVAVVFERMVGE